jgi:D-3-phosphoglycerate dehydrogenase
MRYTPITAVIIEGAVKLKVIVKYGVGIDAIDIEATKRRKIPVVVKSRDPRLLGQEQGVIYA